MYNKLFSKIVRSSIWLQPHTTRIVWLTMLATMDESGFCEFASVGNLAVTAIVTLDEAKAAVKTLESPDEESSDPENEGRRIERVPGGWMVINCQKYKEIVRRTDKAEATRLRVARFREKHKVTPDVTPSNAGVAQVTVQSDTDTDTNIKTSLSSAGASEGRPSPKKKKFPDKRYGEFVDCVDKYWKYKNPSVPFSFGAADGKNLQRFLADNPKLTVEDFQKILRNRAKSEAVSHTQPVREWISKSMSYLSGPQDRYGHLAGEAKPSPFESTPAKSAVQVLREQGIDV